MELKEIPLTPEFKCSDYPKSLAFYTEVLGFDVLYDRVEEGFAMLDREGARIMIDSLAVCDRFVDGDMEKPYGRGLSMQILTQDVQALYDKVKSAEWPIFLDMEEKWYRADDIEVGNKQFLVQDPDGYVLRFYQDLGDRPLTKGE